MEIIPIPTHPEYSISEHGIVFSKRGQPLAARLSHGYPRVGLMENGKQMGRFVHRLVAAAFIGPLPDGYVVNHKDGNKENNHYTNLEYVTHSENMNHAARTGLSAHGIRNNHAVLTDDLVRNIRRMGHELTGSEIARRLGLRQDMISDVLRGKTWKHITDVPLPDTSTKGIRHCFAKLTDDDVREMRRLRKEGASLKELQEKFGVSNGYVSTICSHKDRVDVV